MRSLLRVFVQLSGAAIGAARDALQGSLTDVGIDDSFIKHVRDEVAEKTSVLLLLSADAVCDRIAEVINELPPYELNVSSPCKEKVDKRRDDFLG